MKTIPNTARPNLPLSSENDAVAKLAREIAPLHGGTVSVQDHRGGQVPLYVNTETGEMFVHVGGTWKRVGG